MPSTYPSSRAPRRSRRAALALSALALVGGAGSAAAGTAVARPSHGTSGSTSSSTVAAVQRALGVSADGVYGPVTRRAVRRFQRRRGLTVDGIVGPQTLGALGLSGQNRTFETAANAGRGDDTLARIAQCESGGNPRAVSPDGRYRGKYQFTRETWRSLGGTGDPASAPESVQDQLAARLLASRGTAPWPACAARL